SVSFYQNIGMLVVRHTKTVSGAFCGPCIRATFWSCTLTTALIGWFGMISAFITPIIILINLFQLLASVKLVGWGTVLTGALTVLGIPAVVITGVVLAMHSPGTARH
ncbi:MAG TPA: hypothetical protein VKW04_00015, partial [Planctomycetota bacterium]|nr:hypothetical protein [Planctomycetota bacterium]